ncbi:response regulator transcription factor [Clostridium nigeriense]|uniref:response regulator transcription factor n=1 Tax=Clostridium nigeriense TaxID=1805470 RepID=UPI003D329986
MFSILLVEDEESVAEILKAYFEKEGYEVYHTISGIEAINIFLSKKFDLVILDLMLPDISGERVCKILREKSEAYIFMLTAKGDLESRVEGLNMGADEYLIKPFSPREMIARVNALFRRFDKKENKFLYDDGILIVDSERRIVKLNDNKLAFTPNEFDILNILIKNRGIALTREQIINNVFGDNFDGFDRTIDVHIKNLRKKLESDTKNPKYIITVTKVGYRFGGVF